VAAVATTPMDRSKLDMTANQFPLIGGPLLTLVDGCQSLERLTGASNTVTISFLMSEV
jgi:hypothetical protein